MKQASKLQANLGIHAPSPSPLFVRVACGWAVFQGSGSWRLSLGVSSSSGPWSRTSTEASRQPITNTAPRIDTSWPCTALMPLAPLAVLCGFHEAGSSRFDDRPADCLFQGGWEGIITETNRLPSPRLSRVVQVITTPSRSMKHQQAPRNHFRALPNTMVPTLWCYRCTLRGCGVRITALYPPGWPG